MAYSLPLLVWLRTFEACARHLSFARAARELGLTPAAVGQHVKALEAELGFSLFERLPRGVRLTTIGRAYHPLVRKSLDELTLATLSVFGAPSDGSLTMRCAVSFAALCLAPALTKFRRAYPDFRVKVYASIWGDDLKDDQIDLEIRYGDGRWDGFEVEPLSQAISVPVCPPGKRFGPDPAQALRKLVSHGRIEVVGLESMWLDLSRQLGWRDDSLGAGYAVDTSAVALEMAAAGLGCALVSRDLARLHLARGLVSIPRGIMLRHDRRHFLLTPRRGRPAAVAALAFRDWLIGEFRGGKDD